ncbi:glycogenin-1-like isoform X1 [Salvelinus namaycush]|uniref:glycogenin glucosyltransferase n=1 Tax=Salvelinus namaycush TaxID=8040 RepID=A0A8U0U5B6_SALNM|nr:glycogenin-1-like isoform X1 [Salvelinus namaycush]
MAQDQAFVTLATNDNYARGAMVLGKSLRNHKTTRKLVVMIGPQVSDPCKGVLHKIFDEVLLVDVLDSGDSAHLALMKRPDLGVTFTKLRCWTLTHYSKCVFMDADTLVVQNIDELFDREELSAAPDPGWPDCFNSGVFVFRPSDETYSKLLQYCTEHGSFDGGDQGVLNGYFSNWATADISKHLPFIYNLSSIAIYTYLPAFKQYGGNAKVVHFLGQTKPWSYTYDPTTKRLSGDMQETSTHPSFLLDWWFLYSSSVVPMMAEGYGDQPFHSGCVEVRLEFQSSVKESCDHRGHWPGSWSQIISHKEGGWKGSSTSHDSHHTEPYMSPETSEERKQKWEQGQADYMGMDSFDNIQKKLDAFLK